ncbi:hypothetical protein HQ545_04600 [Candidatus Woesearchaeota archaeon]|nr:hypothetical protein [Candidatus Woesearchaeota archaeon]
MVEDKNQETLQGIVDYVTQAQKEHKESIMQKCYSKGKTDLYKEITGEDMPEETISIDTQLSGLNGFLNTSRNDPKYKFVARLPDTTGMEDQERADAYEKQSFHHAYAVLAQYLSKQDPILFPKYLQVLDHLRKENLNGNDKSDIMNEDYDKLDAKINKEDASFIETLYCSLVDEINDSMESLETKKPVKFSMDVSFVQDEEGLSLKAAKPKQVFLTPEYNKGLMKDASKKAAEAIINSLNGSPMQSAYGEVLNRILNNQPLYKGQITEEELTSLKSNFNSAIWSMIARSGQGIRGETFIDVATSETRTLDDELMGAVSAECVGKTIYSVIAPVLFQTRNPVAEDYFTQENGTFKITEKGLDNLSEIIKQSASEMAKITINTRGNFPGHMNGMRLRIPYSITLDDTMVIDIDKVEETILPKGTPTVTLPDEEMVRIYSIIDDLTPKEFTSEMTPIAHTAAISAIEEAMRGSAQIEKHPAYDSYFDLEPTQESEEIDSEPTESEEIYPKPTQEFEKIYGQKIKGITNKIVKDQVIKDAMRRYGLEE